MSSFASAVLLAVLISIICHCFHILIRRASSRSRSSSSSSPRRCRRPSRCRNCSLSRVVVVQRERCIRKYFLGRGWSGFLILIAAGFVGKFNLGWVRLVWFS